MNNINNVLIKKKASIKKAIAIIDKGRIRMGVVVDKNNKMVGLVTDGDVRRAILNGISIDENVSKIMTKNPVYVEEGDDKKTIYHKLEIEKSKLGLPVLDKKGRVVDIILPEKKGFTYLNKKGPEPRNIEKILVIGGAGFIGSVLTRKLLEKGYKVKVFDKFLYSKDSLKGINNSNLEVREGDTRHVEEVSEAAKDVDAVIHLAELVGDPACNHNTKLSQDVNYLATKIVASVCKHYQINRMIYTSSCSVYGASKGKELLTEESELAPVSLYAKMKRDAEKAILSMRDNNFLPTILRLGTVYGYSYRPRFDLVVNTLTAKALQEGKITIFGGDQWRPNVHVEDVSKAIITVLESPLEKCGGQIFNVGSEEQNLTIKQIGEMIKKEIPEARVIIEDKTIDKRNYRVDFSKIRNELGFKTEKNIIHGIAEIKKAFEKKEVTDYTLPIYHNIKHLKNNGEISR